MKDPILEEVRRAKRKVHEEYMRDPQAFHERVAREMEEWRANYKPQVRKGFEGLSDADLERVNEAWYMPRVARKIRLRKLRAKARAIQAAQRAQANSAQASSPEKNS